MLKLAAIIIVSPVIAYVLAALAFGPGRVFDALFGPAERDAVDFKTLQRKSSPNDYLVCPPDYCSARFDAASPIFETSAAELRRNFLEAVETLPRVTLIARDAENEQYDFEARTPIIGFPDTVTVRFLAVAEQRSSVALYSRSHYGHSDLGWNKRRVNSWLELLKAGASR